MTNLLRAAGRAAAALTIAASAIHAGPSYAWQTDPASIPAPLTAPAESPASQTTLPQDPVPAQPEAPAAPAPLPTIQIPSVKAIAAPRTLEAMVAAFGSTATADAEHECLAGAVFFESKGEPLRGQLTVAEVVINRARSGRFPKSICGVVKQPSQFSFIRAGRFPPIPRATAAWRRAVAIAHIALQDMADGAAPKAMFFHATRVAPRWRGLTRIATVGNHVFYR
jgi:spore germination cell wall hydrolase CwlJ-like protein